MLPNYTNKIDFNCILPINKSIFFNLQTKTIKKSIFYGDIRDVKGWLNHLIKGICDSDERKKRERGTSWWYRSDESIV